MRVKGQDTPLNVDLPYVDGLRYDPVRDGDYHLDRWHVLEDRDRNVRVHCVRTSDPSDMHDHPWDYVSTLLHGSYVEVTEHGAVQYVAPCTLVRTAEHAHRLEVPDGPCWTLLVTGPVRRRWGFHTPAGWVHWRQYAGRGDPAAALARDLGLPPLMEPGAAVSRPW